MFLSTARNQFAEMVCIDIYQCVIRLNTSNNMFYWVEFYVNESKWDPIDLIDSSVHVCIIRWDNRNANNNTFDNNEENPLWMIYLTG